MKDKSSQGIVLDEKSKVNRRIRIGPRRRINQSRVTCRSNRQGRMTSYSL